MLALYISNTGIYRPCIIISYPNLETTEGKYYVQFTRCGKTKWCNQNRIAEYDEQLVDKEVKIH